MKEQSESKMEKVIKEEKGGKVRERHTESRKIRKDRD